MQCNNVRQPLAGLGPQIAPHSSHMSLHLSCLLSLLNCCICNVEVNAMLLMVVTYRMSTTNFVMFQDVRCGVVYFINRFDRYCHFL